MVRLRRRQARAAPSSRSCSSATATPAGSLARPLGRHRARPHVAQSGRRAAEPRRPRRAHRQWGDPEWLLDGSIQQEPKVYDPKRHHTLNARREGSALLVDCDFSGQVAEQPEKLLVRVNSKQEPDICPRVFTFTLADPPQPTIDTDIKDFNPKLGYDVHLSTIDVRGEPSASVYSLWGRRSPRTPSCSACCARSARGSTGFSAARKAGGRLQLEPGALAGHGSGHSSAENSERVLRGDQAMVGP